MKLKKIVSVLMMVCLVATIGALSVNAEAKTPDVVGISDIISDKDGWEDLENLVTVSDGKLTRGASKENDVFAYKNKTFTNEILEFTLFFDKIEEGAMKSVLLRSGEGAKRRMWESTQSYAFNINTNSVELQSYNGAQTQLGVWACEIDPKKEVNVQCGAFEVAGGVQLFMKIDGKLVVNYFDNVNPIKKEGYLAFSARNGFTLKPAQETYEIDNTVVGQYIAPYKMNDEKLTLSYETIGKEGKQSFSWYMADEDVHTPFKTFKVDIVNDRDKLMKKIEGFDNLSELKLSDELMGKYIWVCFENEKGERTFTNQIYIDPLTYKMSDGIYMVNEYEKAYVNGKFTMIDQANDYFTPETFNDTLYLPVRFIAEGFMGKIDWKNDTRAVVMDLNGVKAEIYVDSGNATVNGEAVTLLNMPVMSYNRTMLSASDVEKLFGLTVDISDNLIYVNTNECKLTATEKEAVEKMITENVIE